MIFRPQYPADRQTRSTPAYPHCRVRILIIKRPHHLKHVTVYSDKSAKVDPYENKCFNSRASGFLLFRYSGAYRGLRKRCK